MTIGKDQEGNPHDEREDDGEITLITNTSQQTRKLRMTDQNIQRNLAEQGHGENVELDNNQQEFLRQEIMSPPSTNVREALDVRFDSLEPKEFNSTQVIFEAMELSDRERIQCATSMLKKKA